MLRAVPSRRASQAASARLGTSSSGGGGSSKGSKKSLDSSSEEESSEVSTIWPFALSLTPGLDSEGFTWNHESMDQLFTWFPNIWIHWLHLDILLSNFQIEDNYSLNLDPCTWCCACHWVWTSRVLGHLNFLHESFSLAVCEDCGSPSVYIFCCALSEFHKFVFTGWRDRETSKVEKGASWSINVWWRLSIICCQCVSENSLLVWCSVTTNRQTSVFQSGSSSSKMYRVIRVDFPPIGRQSVAGLWILLNSSHVQVLCEGWQMCRVQHGTVSVRLVHGKYVRC